MDRGKIEDQFIVAYDSLADSIFRYCFFRVSNREVAKDLTQETFTRVWAHIASGNEVKSIKAFLYKTAHNLVIDEYRRKGKNSVSLDGLEEKGFEYSTSEHLRTQEIIDAKLLFREIDSLEREDKEIIMMRYMDEMTPGEIAETLGITENATSVRLNRAKERAKEHLANLNQFK